MGGAGAGGAGGGCGAGVGVGAGVGAGACGRGGATAAGIGAGLDTATARGAAARTAGRAGGGVAAGRGGARVGRSESGRWMGAEGLESCAGAAIVTGDDSVVSTKALGIAIAPTAPPSARAVVSTRAATGLMLAPPLADNAIGDIGRNRGN